MEPPIFKYNPNAYKLGIIKKETATCPVCNQQREYVYDGPFYSEEEAENICPWCISDGSAAKKYDGTFQDEGSIEDVNNENAIDEVIHCTPGYTAWQQEAWSAHCDDLCAFIGYVGSKDIKPFIEELEDDIANSGYDEDQILNDMRKDGSLVGYLFQCLHCGKHRLHVDQD